MTTLRVEQRPGGTEEEDVAKAVVVLDVPAVPHPMVLEPEHGGKLSGESI
jgi:hypothetical protein